MSDNVKSLSIYFNALKQFYGLKDIENVESIGESDKNKIIY